MHCPFITEKNSDLKEQFNLGHLISPEIFKATYYGLRIQESYIYAS